MIHTPFQPQVHVARTPVTTRRSLLAGGIAVATSAGLTSLTGCSRKPVEPTPTSTPPPRAAPTPGSATRGVLYCDGYVGPRAYDRPPLGGRTATFTIVVHKTRPSSGTGTRTHIRVGWKSGQA